MIVMFWRLSWETTNQRRPRKGGRETAKFRLSPICFLVRVEIKKTFVSI